MDIKALLDQQLAKYKFLSEFDSERNSLRYANRTSGIGVSLDLNQLATRFEQNPTVASEEIAYYVKTNLLADRSVAFDLGKVYPILRSTSFPSESKTGARFVVCEHTAETAVYYALDLGDSYRIIDEDMLTSSNLVPAQLHAIALENLKNISFTSKKDTVASNDYYFINQNDGYDASRILLTDYFDKKKAQFKGTMVIAVPHQDVLIIADICNATGYDILAQLAMKFFAEGTTPITSLAFLYENHKLEPIFIMAKNRK